MDRGYQTRSDVHRRELNVSNELSDSLIPWYYMIERCSNLSMTTTEVAIDNRNEKDIH